MDFRQQEYLIALDEERSFLRAAEKLYVTHGTLVHFINKLEEEAGLPLFIRSRSGLIPTHIGKIYIQMAHDILFISRQAMMRLSEERNNANSGFTLVALPNFASDEFPVLYEEFKKNYPDTDITVKMGVHDMIYEMVRDGKADLGLAAGRTEEYVEHEKNLDCHCYDREPLLFVVPKEYPLPREITENKDAPVDLSLFADCKFFLPNYSPALRDLFTDIGFAPHDSMNTPTGLAAFNFIKNGQGVGIVCPSSITDRSAVHCFRLPGNPMYNYYTVFRKNSFFTSAERFFMERHIAFFKNVHAWADEGNSIY